MLKNLKLSKNYGIPENQDPGPYKNRKTETLVEPYKNRKSGTLLLLLLSLLLFIIITLFSVDFRITITI